MSGGYSVLFRTGGEANGLLELTHQGLNSARGDAILAEPGTIAWVEALAMSRILFQAQESVRRLANQFDPLKMTSFIERWESILRIDPGSEESANERRATIATKMGLIGQSALVQTIQDLLNNINAATFVKTLHLASTAANMSWPVFAPAGAGGGTNLGASWTGTIPGGNSVSTGKWFSPVSILGIRVAQPSSMSDADFFRSVNDFKPFLYDFLPAYVSFDWGRYGQQLGTISLSAGGTTVTGAGTAFLTGVAGAVTSGETIEVISDDGVLHDLVVNVVSSDTSLTVLGYSGGVITAQPWKRFGFFLDTQNLDNSFLSA